MIKITSERQIIDNQPYVVVHKIGTDRKDEFTFCYNLFGAINKMMGIWTLKEYQKKIKILKKYRQNNMKAIQDDNKYWSGKFQEEI